MDKCPDYQAAFIGILISVIQCPDCQVVKNKQTNKKISMHDNTNVRHPHTLMHSQQLLLT